MEEVLAEFSELLSLAMGMQMATRYTPKINFVHYAQVIEAHKEQKGEK